MFPLDVKLLTFLKNKRCTAMDKRLVLKHQYFKTSTRDRLTISTKDRFRSNYLKSNVRSSVFSALMKLFVVSSGAKKCLFDVYLII